MSAICLAQPTLPATPLVREDEVLVASPVAATAQPRVRTLRYVQHPSFRTGSLPSQRSWELDARRPLRPRTAA